MLVVQYILLDILVGIAVIKPIKKISIFNIVYSDA